VRAARAPAKRAARPLPLREGGKREKRDRKAAAQPLFPLALFTQGREFANEGSVTSLQQRSLAKIVITVTGNDLTIFVAFRQRTHSARHCPAFSGQGRAARYTLGSSPCCAVGRAGRRAARSQMGAL